jgi:cyclic pyranopterin phosphate synthase
MEIARGFGIRKLKITGGEPLLRADIVEIVRAATQNGSEDVSLTTNGTLLAALASKLADAGLERINVSLDTLNEEKYRRITGKLLLGEVIRGIDSAIDAGLSPVKLNMVLLRGINVDEVEQMIGFAKSKGGILQLIELLQTPSTKDVYEKFHFRLATLERELEKRAERIDVRREMQARRRYLIDGAEVEVVRPMHNSQFCAHCTRLRLSSDGWLRPCLMRDDNLVDISKVLENGDTEQGRYLFLEAIQRREPYFR